MQGRAEPARHRRFRAGRNQRRHGRFRAGRNQQRHRRFRTGRNQQKLRRFRAGWKQTIILACSFYRAHVSIVQEASCAYVIILMAVYWCTEALPLAVTSLLPAVLFPMLGIMQSKMVCMQYLKDTNMLFVGGLMVAVAVEHWNLHKRIALRVLLIVGVRPALLMLGFMGVTAFLSMWISNTATTAMMVPIVQAVLEQLNKQETESSRMTCGEGRPQYIPYFLVVLHMLDGSPEPKQNESAEKRLMAKGMTLCVCYAASIGGTATLTGTVLNKHFTSTIFVSIRFHGIQTWGCGAVKSKKEISAYNVIREQHLQLGPMCFGELSVLALFSLLVALWFTRDPGFVEGWATHTFNTEAEYVTDATVAIFIAMLLFILPSRQPRLCFGSSTEPQIYSVPSPALLSWKVAQKKLPWNIVLLLGGGFALAKGSEESGLSRWMGNQLTPLHSIPPWAIVIILCLLIAIFTECTSNVATATLFLPVLASMSQSVGINPLYIMVPCTLSASFAFMLPVATPPNAIVFSYGYLKVSDMARTGMMMNVIGIFCITLSINTWGKAMFKLDSFPAWANQTVI
uniref:Solute carrier family 13 member 5-like n=1 Tax=Sinocyclocheilus anshuiensis TaxID=1608454 RepID=A0A671MPW9_9TELE